MQINSDISLRTYFVIFGCCIAAIILTVCVLFHELFRTKDYICVDGNITDITKNVRLGIENNTKASTVHYIHCSYEVDGIKYQVKYRTFLWRIKHVGDPVKIYCSTENPEDVRNFFIIEVSICGILFFSIISFLLFKAISIRKAYQAS